MWTPKFLQILSSVRNDLWDVVLTCEVLLGGGGHTCEVLFAIQNVAPSAGHVHILLWRSSFMLRHIWFWCWDCSKMWIRVRQSGLERSRVKVFLFCGAWWLHTARGDRVTLEARPPHAALQHRGSVSRSASGGIMQANPRCTCCWTPSWEDQTRISTAGKLRFVHFLVVRSLESATPMDAISRCASFF